MILAGIISAAGGGGGGPGADDGLAHRYWRVLVDANSGNVSYVSIAILELKAWPSGLNTSMDHDSTKAIVSDERAGWEGSQAFNGLWPEGWTTTEIGIVAGVTDVVWSPTASLIVGEWLGFDYGVGNAVRIREFDIQARVELSFANQTARDVTLQYSDDAVSWVSVESFTTSNFTSAGERKTYTVTGAPAQSTVEASALSTVAVMGGRTGAIQANEIGVRVVTGANGTDKLNASNMAVYAVIEP